MVEGRLHIPYEQNLASSTMILKIGDLPIPLSPRTLNPLKEQQQHSSANSLFSNLEVSSSNPGWGLNSDNEESYEMEEEESDDNDNDNDSDSDYNSDNASSSNKDWNNNMGGSNSRLFENLKVS